ncbi:MAG: ISXO2-like transposase domain protein, partial [Candidatus Parvibacillus calidus]
ADKHGKKRPRKVKVLIGIEKKGGGAARSYVKVIGRASTRKAKAFIGKKIDSQATINMDEAARRCCNGHCIMPGEGPDKALAHRVVTNMINWLYARHGHVTYLQDYLNEYCYRYNRHRMKGEILDDIISRMVRHRPMTGKISACR